MVVFLLLLTLLATSGVAAGTDDDSVGTHVVAKPELSGRKLNLPSIPYRYSSLDLPEDLVAALDRLDNTPVDNPLTDHGATLLEIYDGDVEYYD